MTPIIRRLRKLASLARDQQGMPEGEAAAAQVRKLMAEHAVSMADLSEAAQDAVVKGVQELGSKSMWRRALLTEVAAHANCIAYFTPGATSMEVWGHASGIEIVRYLYEMLAREIEKRAKAYTRGLPAWMDKGERRKAHGSFVVSAVAALGLRLRALRTEHSDADPEGSQLVHARMADVQRAAGKGKQHSVTHTANAAGHAAGNAIALRNALDAHPASRARLALRD
jgi:hypothetical protein